MINKDQAIRLHESRFWEKLSPREIAEFQLFTTRLCMPFDVFHKALEKSLGRPVWTHELVLDADGIKRGFLGSREAPSMDDIIGLLPADKIVIVAAPEASE